MKVLLDSGATIEADTPEKLIRALMQLFMPNHIIVAGGVDLAPSQPDQSTVFVIRPGDRVTTEDRDRLEAEKLTRIKYQDVFYRLARKLDAWNKNRSTTIESAEDDLDSLINDRWQLLARLDALAKTIREYEDKIASLSKDVVGNTSFAVR